MSIVVTLNAFMKQLNNFNESSFESALAANDCDDCTISYYEGGYVNLKYIRILADKPTCMAGLYTQLNAVVTAQPVALLLVY